MRFLFETMIHGGTMNHGGKMNHGGTMNLGGAMNRGGWNDSGQSSSAPDHGAPDLEKIVLRPHLFPLSVFLQQQCSIELEHGRVGHGTR
jgi:hypothetical protein